MRQLAAAHRLHHDEGKPPAVQDLHLAAGVLQGPVQVVELDLDELDDLPVRPVQDLLQVVGRGVAGKPQMLDASGLTLLREVFEDAPARIHVVVQAVLTDIVVEIEIEVIHAALLELALECACRIEGPAVLVSGEFVGDHPALPRIVGEDLADDGLGVAVVVGQCRIEIVDAVLDGIIRHLSHGVEVDCLVWQERETHRPESQS